MRYYQEVDDGTFRFQARTEFAHPLDKICDIMCKPTFEIFGQGLTSVLESHGEFQIMKSVTPLSNKSTVSLRECIYYNWNVEQYDVVYRAFVSVEPDDECGHAKIDGDSPYVRATLHPGTFQTILVLPSIA